MATGTRPQIGNVIFDMVLYGSFTPPAAITTAVVNNQTYTVAGLQVGDLVSWNLISPTSNLITIANAYVSAVNTLTLGWTTEGATVNSAPAQQVLLEVMRPENGSMGYSFLPANVS